MGTRCGARSIAGRDLALGDGSFVFQTRRPATAPSTRLSGPSQTQRLVPGLRALDVSPRTASAHTRPPISPSPAKPPSTRMPSPRATGAPRHRHQVRLAAHRAHAGRACRRARRGDRRRAPRRGAGGRRPRGSRARSRARTSAERGAPLVLRGPFARAHRGVDGAAVERGRRGDVLGPLEAPLDLERGDAELQRGAGRARWPRGPRARAGTRGRRGRAATPSTTSSYGRRHACAQAPRLALRPPMASLVRHWPE